MESPEKIQTEYEQLLEKLTDPGLISQPETLEKLSAKKQRLEKILEKEKELEAVKRQIEESRAILNAQEDKELAALAESEMSGLKEREEMLNKEIAGLLKSKDQVSQEPQEIIVEIRAGAGGKESALFARDIFRMYSKYAASQNWQKKILDSHTTEIGGFKEIIFSLKGNNAFSQMKGEAGVHRVQRIPKTEKSGRVHTSTVTVAVLPKPKAADIKIKPDEIKVDFYRSSGPGGQYVNKRETAVRITHLPTGLVVTSQTERNQLQNKENALAILSARLLEKKETEEQQRIGGKRKTQIGKAKRAEKIRTYNFPQDRVTDHRAKKSWHNIEQIMEGKLDEIMKSLRKSEQPPEKLI